MTFDSLLALASGRRWDELMAALTRPENRPLCPEVVVRFEELGDRSLASGSVLDATKYFSAATTCAMILLYAPASGEDPAWLAAPFARLSQKGPAARRRFDEERVADAGKPVEAMATDVVPPPAVPEKKAAKPAPEPKVILETLLQKLEKLARQKRTTSWTELIGTQENRTFCRQIAERFEALGDEHREKEQSAAIEFYQVAYHALDLGTLHFVSADLARVEEKRHKLEEAILDEQIAHPVASDFDPEPLDFSHGMDSVQLLVLAGRFDEAGQLLTKVRRLDPNLRILGRLEATGDRLARKHPEMARWYYQRFLKYAHDIPGDRADDIRISDSIIHTAEQKLESVKPRRPRRRATIRLSLAGWGNPTGSSPEPQISSQTMESDGLLELAPEWVFAQYRQEGGGLLRPEQWPARYRYRVFVGGRQVQLTQTDDEYGRSQPFDLGEPAAATDARRAPPFRLKIGKPVTIHCRVAGGGPEWTLTLSGIDEMPAL